MRDDSRDSSFGFVVRKGGDLESDRWERGPRPFDEEDHPLSSVTAVFGAEGSCNIPEVWMSRGGGGLRMQSSSGVVTVLANDDWLLDESCEIRVHFRKALSLLEPFVAHRCSQTIVKVCSRSALLENPQRMSRRALRQTVMSSSEPESPASSRPV